MDNSSELSRVYEAKGAAEVEQSGQLSVKGQDLWVAQQVKEARTVLDVGCGQGRMVRLLKAEVYGIDISASLVNAAAAAGYVRAVECDVSNQPIPYESGFFDAVICLDVLEHLVDPVFALAEINRVLKPGGTVCVITPNVAFFVSRIAMLFGHHMDTFETSSPPLHLRYYTFNSFIRMLNKTGYDLDKIAGYPVGRGNKGVSALWRYTLRLLARIRPQLFAREIVLTARKAAPPKDTSWSYPPVGNVKGWKRLKNLWNIT